MSTRTVPQGKAATFEEVAELDADSQPGELDAGRWVPVTKNTFRHGQILLTVSAILRDFIRANPDWRASAGDPGAKLAHAPDVLRGPDIAILRKDRVPTGKGVEGWIEGAPEVAIEIVGDSQSVAELIRKSLEYLRAGARAVWILDPGPRSVIVITAAREPRVIGPEDTLEGDEALPGFACRVADFFEE